MNTINIKEKVTRYKKYRKEIVFFIYDNTYGTDKLISFSELKTRYSLTEKELHAILDYLLQEKLLLTNSGSLKEKAFAISHAGLVWIEGRASSGQWRRSA